MLISALFIISIFFFFICISSMFFLYCQLLFFHLYIGRLKFENCYFQELLSDFKHKINYFTMRQFSAIRKISNTKHIFWIQGMADINYLIQANVLIFNCRWIIWLCLSCSKWNVCNISVNIVCSNENVWIRTK